MIVDNSMFKLSYLQYVPLLALLSSACICKVLHELKGQRTGKSWLLFMRSCKIQSQVTQSKLCD